MRFILFFIVMLLLLTPAHAELFNELGEPIPGEGPKGRYTVEQILPFALQFMPGTLLKQSTSWQNDDLYHEFVIQTEDGSIYELEYYALSGELYEIEAERLSDDPILPPGLIDQQQAESIAREYTENHTQGRLPTKVRESKLGIHNRKLAYFVDLRKGTKDHQFVIGALSGKILN